MMKINFIINLILFNFLSFAIAFNSYSLNSNPDFAFINYLNEWEEIPLANGTWIFAHKSQIEFELKEFATRKNDALSNITFKLFTKLNPTNGQKIFLNDKNSIEKSNFNPEYPTRFIVHGWLNNEYSHFNYLLREAYLKRNEFFNIIIMDWGSIASKSYQEARSSIISVGKLLSRFIDFLHVDGKLSFKTLYLSGHSLGAHICGIAGKNVNKGKINTIVGLDPAGPLFSYHPVSERISNTDAEYVEVIHTDINRYGFKQPIGKASFYPNGGSRQPGCSRLFDDILGCSHARAYEFFAESIVNNKFLPYSCQDFNGTEGKCMWNMKKYKMGGEPLNHGKNAIYYLRTRSVSPFGLG